MESAPLDTAGLVERLQEIATHLSPVPEYAAEVLALHEAVDALTAKDSELSEMRRTIDHNDRTIVEEFERVLSLQRELAEARAALEEIARQKLTRELRAEFGRDYETDWEGGYDGCIRRARTVLSREKEASSNE